MEKPFNRRNFITKSAALAGSTFLIPNIIFGNKKNPEDEILGHGSHKYKVVPDWGVLGSSTPVKDCHEMVQDSKGRLILLTNETKNNVIIYDKSGKLLKTWGNEWPGAHGLTLAKEGGEEFLFITDHDRHEVYKTTLDGKVIMTIKYPVETGVYTSADQFKPTEVAVAPNGDFYIVDGYGEQWVIQYNNKGEYIRHFGGKGEKEENIKNGHGVTLDHRDKSNPILLVTSREQNSFKRFTQDGKYLSTVHIPGLYICRPVVDDQNVYFSVLVSKMPWDSRSGFVTILDKNNKVISNPGGSQPTYENGALKQAAQVNNLFKHPHDVCVDNDKNLYIPQWNSDKVYPIKLQRV